MARTLVNHNTQICCSFSYLHPPKNKQEPYVTTKDMLFYDCNDLIASARVVPCYDFVTPIVRVRPLATICCFG